MISLILATYNRHNELKVFFNSIMGTSIEYEIIVVDQNDKLSLDSLILEYKEKGLKLVHIKTIEKNLSNARNIGLANAKYDIVGFPDDDCYYETETLSNIVHAFNNKIGDIIIGRWIENEYKYINVIKELVTHDIVSFRTNPFSSITIFANKKVLVGLGGFDVRLGVGQWFGSAEETDLIIRATQQNFKISFVPSILVHHKYSNSVTNINYRQTISRSRGIGAIYMKNNLPLYTILRGISSPILKSITCLNFKMFLNYWCMFYGRITGCINWIT